MGRTRRIMKDDILDAAERVVVKLGAARLSIDAVAQEAGVSKSTVVYDQKSKSALLEAMIDRQVSAERKLLDQAVKDNADSAHPELFGRISVAAPLLNGSDKAVAMAISASIASDDKLLETMREWTVLDLKAMGDGPKPEAALMAYLTLTGFYCTELFDFHTWDAAQRQNILEGIVTIYASYPDKG